MAVPPPGDFSLVAVIVVPPATSTNPPASVSFFSPKAQPNLLYYNDPPQLTADQKLQPSVLITASYSEVFSWDPSANIIHWGYKSADQTATITPVSSNSISGATSTLSASSSALSSTSAAPVTLSTTSNTLGQASTSAHNPTSSTSPKSKQVSSGSAAGIAIGCFLAGALITALLLWVCLGRARKKRNSRYQGGSSAAFSPHEQQPNDKSISLESGNPVSQGVESSLPQPLEDKAISGEISKISNLIKNHVQSYYHNGRVSPGLLDIDDLYALGSDLPISPGTLSTLLANSVTREIALRFCIAWVLVSRMQLSGDPNSTLLPPEIAKCFQSMTSIPAPQNHSLFMSKWRAITAELTQSNYKENSIPESDSRNYSIRQALETLDGILRPYADSRVDNNQRRRNLEEILKRAASFAFTLFSQPSSWKFDWKDDQSVKNGNLCVFPALLQVSDENGKPLLQPRPFSEAVVRQLDG